MIERQEFFLGNYPTTFSAERSPCAAAPAWEPRPFSPAAAQTASGEPAWRHALSLFGDVKYPAGFKRFDYVNPDAPQGRRRAHDLDRHLR